MNLCMKHQKDVCIYARLGAMPTPPGPPGAALTPAHGSLLNTREGRERDQGRMGSHRMRPGNTRVTCSLSLTLSRSHSLSPSCSVSRARSCRRSITPQFETRYPKPQTLNP